MTELARICPGLPHWEDYLNELDRQALEVEAIERAEEDGWWESLYDTMRPWEAL